MSIAPLRRTPRRRCAGSPSPPSTRPPHQLHHPKGVTRPVRPTLTWMSSSRVVTSAGGYLYAIAQRGAREVDPSTPGPRPRRLTTPSRLVLHRVSVLPVLVDEGLCLGASRRRGTASRPATHEPGRHTPRFAGRRRRLGPLSPRPWTSIRSGRDAVTRRSFWRSEPAAPLRGLERGLPPDSTSAALRRSKAATGKTSPAPRDLGMAGPGEPVRDAVDRHDISGDVSPVRPSPRVAHGRAARVRESRLTASPSIFSSAEQVVCRPPLSRSTPLPPGPQLLG